MSVDSFFDRLSRRHPLQTMMNLIIAGITVLFTSMLLLFAFSGPARHLGGQHFPKLFFASTGIILLSSWTISNAVKAFLAEKAIRWRNWLLATLMLAAGFSASQYFGWKQLWSSGITLYEVRRGIISETEDETNAEGFAAYAASKSQAPVHHFMQESTHTPSGAFLYVISGLHLLHLAGGLVFLLLSVFKAMRSTSEPLKAMVVFSDPVELVRAKMLARYWHYLDALWVILFLYFLWFFV